MEQGNGAWPRTLKPTLVYEWAWAVSREDDK